MLENAIEFDTESVTRAWDTAAAAYAHGQASGRDYYRYEFLGPAQVAACGVVESLQLLDVGCGAGYFAREMARRGAHVTGVDISPQMIEYARREEVTESLGIQYRVSDAAEIDALFPAATFDAATSCLALQDMPEVAKVLSAIHTVLRPGGRFVASITHPCSNPPYRKWERDEAGRKRWLCLDRYFDEGPTECAWPNWAYEFSTPLAHATLATWCEWILNAGFRIRGLQEPSPSEQALASRPDLEDATRMPYFLILDLTSA